MITLVTGLPGAGKSLFALYVMQEALRSGQMVATNIELTRRCPFHDRVVFYDDREFPVFQIDERYEGRQRVVKHRAFWHYMPGGVVHVIDEADNYFDSMDFARLAEVGTDVRLYFKQHRKRKDDFGREDTLYLLVQNPDNLWIRIRRMVQRFVVCENTVRQRRMLRYLPRCFWSFVRAEYGHESCVPETLLSSGYFTYGEGRSMFSWYSSDQLIGARENYNWGGLGGRDDFSGGGVAVEGDGWGPGGAPAADSAAAAPLA